MAGLVELARQYREAEKALATQLKGARALLKGTDDPEMAFGLRKKIQYLEEDYTYIRKMATLCERYYERGFFRDEAFCFSTPAGYHKEKIAGQKRTYYKGNGNSDA